MESKKNKKYDLEPKRPLFFGVGMIISLSLALVAFEWKSPIDPIKLFDQESEFIDEYLPPITINQPPPPPPPKAIDIIPVEDDEPATEDIPEIDISIEEEESIPEIIMEDEPVEVVEEPLRSYAEVMPSFQGGMKEFYKFVGDNIKYPTRASRMGVEGKVFIQFVVEKDGSLSNIQAVKGIGAGCDEEAVRVMKLVPKFKPAKQGDIRVRVQMVIPILFQLQ